MPKSIENRSPNGFTLSSLLQGMDYGRMMLPFGVKMPYPPNPQALYPCFLRGRWARDLKIHRRRVQP